MKSILEFQMPEDRYEFEHAVKAEDYLHVLTGMREFLRNKLKYAELTDTEHKIFETVQNKFFELLIESNTEI